MTLAVTIPASVSAALYRSRRTDATAHDSACTGFRIARCPSGSPGPLQPTPRRSLRGGPPATLGTSGPDAERRSRDTSRSLDSRDTPRVGVHHTAAGQRLVGARPALHVGSAERLERDRRVLGRAGTTRPRRTARRAGWSRGGTDEHFSCLRPRLAVNQRKRDTARRVDGPLHVAANRPRRLRSVESHSLRSPLRLRPPPAYGPSYQGMLYGRRRPPPMASAASPPMTGGPYPLVR